MERQISLEKVRGAGGQTCGMVNKQALVIGLSLARQQTGKKDKVWLLQAFIILAQQGLKSWRVSRVRCVCELESFLSVVCVCVSSALGEERTGGSLIEDGMCAETLDFLRGISCTGISK